MKAVLPGKPEPRLQALSTGYWNSRRITAYITGNAFAILTDPDTLVQTIYDDDDEAPPLEAISLDEATGKIAVSTRDTIRIYKPFGLEENALKWALQSTLPLARPADGSEPLPSPSLSWGCSEELLVARDSLELFQTISNPSSSWKKRLANPVKLAALTYDSAYIASVGLYDCLPKVWRRLTYGPEDVRFDFSYLRHPQPVTNLQWRRPYHVDQTIENVLYTFCADNILRIWMGSDSHGQQPVQLWGKLDLAASIQDAALGAGSSTLRWGLMLHGRDFSGAVEGAVVEGEPPTESGDSALQHLIAVANRGPEVCLVFDGRGRMSAWGFENLGAKVQSRAKIFNIAYVKSKDFDFIQGQPDGLIPHVEAYTYSNRSDGKLHLLIHYFDGKVEVYGSNIVQFLDVNPRSKHLTLDCVWSGHSAPIKKIVRNFSGRAIVSRTAKSESVVWKHALNSKLPTLLRQVLIPGGDQVHRICVLRKGRFVVFLYRDRISLWDCREAKPNPVAERRYHISGTPLCLLNLPREKAEDYTTAHIATITSEKHGVVWEVKLPSFSPDDALPVMTNDHQKPSIREFFSFELEGAGDLAYVLPMDPAGSSYVISGFLDVFARDVAVSYTHSGEVQFWTARVDQKRSRVEWLSTCSMDTGVAEPALVSGSTMKKAALVDSTRTAVTIWDIRGAQLEYSQAFETHNTIQDLDWTSTPDSQSILAVGFPYRVLLLSQMRFDYLNKGPAWAPIREINIRDFTPHPIGDSTWLGDGHLVIGAGNQLYVYDRHFDVSDSLVTSLRLPQRKKGMWDLFDVVQRLNGPLPVFHPQFLSQCILSGKIDLVHSILMNLHKTLKFWVEGDTIDDYLGMDLEQFYLPNNTQSGGATRNDVPSHFSRRMSYDDSDEVFSEEVAGQISEKLTTIGIPQLSGHEQIQLMDIVECLGLVEQQRRSLDENGARFMLFFRQHALRKRRTNEVLMSWREINWAYHSTSQDILVDFVSRQHHGTLLWETARESGMFMWLTDNTAVKEQFEVIARNEYTKSEVKNPVDCSLFYLALKKKTVLQGLWRMASWNREQAATLRFLANNFDDPKWKTAALKNAYALLSKRRFAYAAAFFLLGDSLQDAVNVCLNQLRDLQLAVAVARVYEGDQGPVLKRLLECDVLSIAAQEGNRWLASWAFWMLHRRDMAVRALVTPVYTLIETPGSPDLQSKLFLTDDPALVVLYAQLRQKTLQTLRGASKVTPKVEWEFVLHNARLYDRMGCDLLGLDLVRNWEFLRTATTIAFGLGGEIDPIKLVKRRSSLVVADLPVSPITSRAPADDKAPTVFEEPDANSLLDSFGF
ncbi:hypothetical protein VTK73DRAFT_3300 [Phialemonium thermophilum]|uniref:RAVE complex protein Rav1 C-terminal domain-containing protein n=1 Tax=Phialemonium thermophilum TaxID=223376 RepID=A0ABR3Y102_9PEZI